MNEFGIMLNSILTATIIEGRGLLASKLKTFMVRLAIEKQSVESEVVGVDGADPVWNEIVTFDITTGREPVIVQVFDGTASRLVGRVRSTSTCSSTSTSTTSGCSFRTHARANLRGDCFLNFIGYTLGESFYRIF